MKSERSSKATTNSEEEKPFNRSQCSPRDSQIISSYREQTKNWVKNETKSIYKVKEREIRQIQAEISRLSKRKHQNNKMLEMLSKMEESSARKNWSRLHSFAMMKWLKKHRPETTKMEYLYTPEEVQKHLDLKRIFEVFDEDHSETLDLDEFVEMFIQNYITKYYSSHQKILDSSQQENMGTKGEEEAQLSSEDDLEKVRRFLEERFLEIFKEATEDDHLFLPEFISLALNGNANEKYSNVIRDLRKGEFLKEDSMKTGRSREAQAGSGKKEETGPEKMSKLEFLPTSFETMLNFLSYRTNREQLCEDFVKENLWDKKLKLVDHIFQLKPKDSQAIGVNSDPTKAAPSQNQKSQISINNLPSLRGNEEFENGLRKAKVLNEIDQRIRRTSLILQNGQEKPKTNLFSIKNEKPERNKALERMKAFEEDLEETKRKNLIETKNTLDVEMTLGANIFFHKKNKGKRRQIQKSMVKYFVPSKSQRKWKDVLQANQKNQQNSANNSPEDKVPFESPRKESKELQKMLKSGPFFAKSLLSEATSLPFENLAGKLKENSDLEKQMRMTRRSSLEKRTGLSFSTRAQKSPLKKRQNDPSATMGDYFYSLKRNKTKEKNKRDNSTPFDFIPESAVTFQSTRKNSVTTSGHRYSIGHFSKNFSRNSSAQMLEGLSTTRNLFPGQTLRVNQISSTGFSSGSPLKYEKRREIGPFSGFEKDSEASKQKEMVDSEWEKNKTGWGFGVKKERNPFQKAPSVPSFSLTFRGSPRIKENALNH